MHECSLRNRRSLDVRKYWRRQLCAARAGLSMRLVRLKPQASGPGPRTAEYNENLQSRTTLGTEISRENLRAGLLKFLPQRGPGSEGPAVAPGPESLSCLRARRDHDPALCAAAGARDLVDFQRSNLFQRCTHTNFVLLCPVLHSQSSTPDTA